MMLKDVLVVKGKIDKRRFHCPLASLGIILITSLLLTSFQKKTPRFEDMYDCYIITDIEASPYNEDEFEQIDCDDFMEIIARAKLSNKEFVPYTKVNLYDDEGIRYRLYISKSARYFRIDGNYFRLTRSQAKRLTRTINS
ncbi:MAG: hypothetical protein J6X86_01185 [Bacteroidales bacterium]|nr:hypothetical protein [Bacteroidales bacterium]